MRREGLADAQHVGGPGVGDQPVGVVLAERGVASALVEERREGVGARRPRLGRHGDAAEWRRLGPAPGGGQRSGEVGGRVGGQAEALRERHHLALGLGERGGRDTGGVADGPFGAQQQRVAAAPEKGVVGGAAHRGYGRLRLLHEVAATARLGPVPPRHVAIRPDRRRGLRPVIRAQEEGAVRLVRAHAARPDGRVRGLGVGVQRLAGVPERLAVRRVHARRSERERPLQLREQLLLVGLVAVEFEAGVAQPEVVEPSLDDLQRRHLLGHEQHALAAPERLGDDVGDGLRLARAGWPLDDERQPARHVEQRERLRRVGVDDLVAGIGGQQRVERRVVREAVLRRLEAVAEQRPHDRVRARSARVLPARRVEVLVHRQLAEGEEAERHRLALHAPIPLPPHRTRHGIEVGGQVEVVVSLWQREVQPRVLPQLGAEREVALGVLAGRVEAERRPPGVPAQLGRDQQEGGAAARVVAGGGPVQHPEREEEHAHALFLEVRAGAAVRREQPAFQRVGWIGRLEREPARARGQRGVGERRRAE